MVHRNQNFLKQGHKLIISAPKSLTSTKKSVIADMKQSTNWIHQVSLKLLKIQCFFSFFSTKKNQKLVSIKTLLASSLTDHLVHNIWTEIDENVILYLAKWITKSRHMDSSFCLAAITPKNQILPTVENLQNYWYLWQDINLLIPLLKRVS